jgi:putative radical SAM enzyme (TIGR03279 family)
MELTTGDQVIAVDGQAIRDVLDLQYYTAEDQFSCIVRKADGEIWKLKIEREQNEALGWAFDQISADGLKTCVNQCIFCFVAQMPAGMRRSLYDKDDDYRLSLTQGSFITLSNLNEADVQRIIDLRLSPLYISVHAWNPDIRVWMMRSPKAANLPDQMKRLAQAGLTMHAQIVVLPGVNDGECLWESVRQLRILYPAVQSIGVVPVGLTKYRQGLTSLRTFTADEAKEILVAGQNMQRTWRVETGRSIVYFADEWYALAGLAFPALEMYDDLSQLENGIGMASKFNAEIAEIWDDLPQRIRAKRVHLITGSSAAGYFTEWAQRLRRRVAGLELIVHKITNEFFGETITVAGLLTAQDIARQVPDLQGEDVLIPRVMLNADAEVFLDDYDVSWLAERMNGRVIVAENHGRSFLQGILKKGMGE